MDFKILGRYVLSIKNGIFEATIPAVNETVNYALDEDLEVKKRWYTVNGKKIPEVNVLWFVKGVTSDLVCTLGTRDKILLLKDYYLAVKVLASVINHENSIIRLIKNDYDDAIDNILDTRDYSASIRASLKLAGRAIKAKLESEGKGFKPDEELRELVKQLTIIKGEELEEVISNLESLSRRNIDESPVNLEEAVKTLKNSLRLYLKLFHPSKDPRITIRK